MLSTILFYSCEKEQIENYDINNNDKITNPISSISSRSSGESSPEYDIEWVKDFQLYLQNLDAGQSTNSTYSLEEAVYGLEYLFNFKHSTNVQGITRGGAKIIIDIPEANNWLSLYYQIENHLDSEISSKPNLDFNFVNISIEDFEGEAKISAIIIYNLFNEHVEEQYSGRFENGNSATFCENEPFTDEFLFPGVGGRDGDDIVFPCNPDFGTCGNAAACEIPDLYALEEVERLNDMLIRNEISCPKGSEPYWTDINFIQLEQEAQLLSTIASTSCFPVEYNFIGPCTCMDADFLNCFFCTTQSILTSPEVQSQIPEGYQLLDTDIWVEPIGVINSQADLYYFIRIRYGKVECRVGNPREEPAIIMGF